MIQRPQHLLASTLWRLGEEAVLVRESGGTRNAYGEWVSGPTTETAIRIATYPEGLGTSDDQSLHQLLEAGGIRIDDVRRFYTQADVSPGDDDRGGDILRWQGHTYEVMQVVDYSTYREIRAVQQDR